VTQPAGTSPAGEDWDERANGLICALPQHDADSGIEAVARRREKQAHGNVVA
jgi:hypothetical protein